jgi:hypothetical protein
MTQRQVSINILRLLIKHPDCSFRTIRHYFKGKYNMSQIGRAIVTLYSHNYISKTGEVKHLTYNITKEGLDVLDKIEARELRSSLLKNVATEIDKLISLGEGGYNP